MGRPKEFSREQVLEAALPVFWQHGFADASLHEIEQATGVRKSGLYAEFKDKADLFVESLRFYLAKQEQQKLLDSKPLGWKNIERFLKLAPANEQGTKGCFAVNSMRELSILPSEVGAIIEQSRFYIRKQIAANLGAAEPFVQDTDAISELILTFFTGESMEISLRPSKAARDRKIDLFLDVLQRYLSPAALTPSASVKKTVRRSKAGNP